MKVLGFVGSPRKKGNTDVLVDTFLDGASSGGAEVKKYFLADNTINQCQGCYRKCILAPGFRCGTFRDDMDLLLQEMVSSDLILRWKKPTLAPSIANLSVSWLSRSASSACAWSSACAAAAVALAARLISSSLNSRRSKASSPMVPTTSSRTINGRIKSEVIPNCRISLWTGAMRESCWASRMARGSLRRR